jgi:hypothetical protein
VIPSFLHWTTTTWLLVDLLAVYRLSRLIARDELLRPFRQWLDAKYTGPLVYLFQCIWCLSIWVSAAVVALTWWQPYAWSFVAAGLAFSAGAGLIGERVA